MSEDKLDNENEANLECLHCNKMFTTRQAATHLEIHKLDPKGQWLWRHET